MKKNLIILFCLWSLIFKAYPQQAQLKTAIDIWEKLILSDDREKNFLLPSFLEISSKIVFCDCEELFPEWVYKDVPDTDLLFLAGVLPFSNQNSLLIWIISSEKENNSWTFTKELDFSGASQTGLSVEFNENQAVSILVNDKQYVDVPNLQIKLLFSKLNENRVDSEKEEISRQIWENLQTLLEDKLLFDNNFSDFEQLSTIISEDKKVKISTWNIVFQSGEQIFFGGLVIMAAGIPVVYKLSDMRGSINNPAVQVLSPNKWYGCIYYDIIVNKQRNNRFYTLIGFNGNNAFTQIKLIDVLTFSDGGNPSPKFGASLFDDNFKNNRRLIFEYGKRTTMMLRYDTSLKMIVMDNLAPSEPFYRNDFRYYGPDFSHNGLKFDKGKWIYFSDIELRNPFGTTPQEREGRGNRIRSLELDF